MKYYFATHLDTNGIACAALLLRKYNKHEIEIDFLTTEEASITSKKYDFICGLPISMNANPIVNVKNSTIESENNTELSENKKPVLNQNNTTELLRQYLDLEDKTSKQISFFNSSNNRERHSKYKEFERLIKYLSSSKDTLRLLAEKWASLGNGLFVDSFYRKHINEMNKEIETVQNKLRLRVSNSIIDNSQIILINALNSISPVFIDVAFDYLFDHSAKVVGIIHSSSMTKIEKIEISMKVNPSFYDEFDLLPISQALDGSGTRNQILAKSISCEHIVGTIAKKVGCLNSFSYLILDEVRKTNFPYSKLLCFDASMPRLYSDELKSLIFPDLEKALSSFIEIHEIDECVIVQKCNCTEIYVVHNSTDSDKIKCLIINKWKMLLGHEVEPEIWNKIKVHYAKETIFHLYRVTSSLESLIIGDGQVLSQVISSYNLADKMGTAKNVLSHIFKQSFIVAKKIYAETNLHGHGISLGRVAVALMMRDFSSPCEIVTVVGSGQISDIVVNAINKKWKNTRINIVTHRVEYVRQKYTDSLIVGHDYQNLINCLNKSDAVIFCTYSEKPLLNKLDLQGIIEHKRLKVLIDLGMPPNTECVESTAILIHSLSNVVEYGKIRFQQRKEEAKIAEDIIENAYNGFEETIIEFKQHRIIEKLAPEIYKAVEKKNIESSIIGIMIRLLGNLSIDELNAIELAVDKIQTK